MGTAPGEQDARTRPPGPLAEIEIGDDAVDWESLGFVVVDAACRVGQVTLRFAGRDDERGRGIVGWTLRTAGPAGDVDGLPTAYHAPDVGEGASSGAGAGRAAGTTGDRGPAVAPSRPHPNGVTHIDHLVVTTPDLDRTTEALAAMGLDPRRTRPAGRGRLQRFFRMGEVVLEVVGPDQPAGDAAATFWGLAFTVADIDATAAHLVGRIGAPQAAVQQGRLIATVRNGDEVSVPIAMMSAPLRPPAGGSGAGASGTGGSSAGASGASAPAAGDRPAPPARPDLPDVPDL